MAAAYLCVSLRVFKKPEKDFAAFNGPTALRSLELFGLSGATYVVGVPPERNAPLSINNRFQILLGCLKLHRVAPFILLNGHSRLIRVLKVYTEVLPQRLGACATKFTFGHMIKNRQLFCARAFTRGIKQELLVTPERLLPPQLPPTTAHALAALHPAEPTSGQVGIKAVQVLSPRLPKNRGRLTAMGPTPHKERLNNVQTGGCLSP